MFHIGSGTIIAAHVLLEPRAGGVIPHIENSVIIHLSIPVELQGIALVSAMRQALKKSAEQMVSQKIGSPDEIICFLESPWYATQVRNVRVTKNTPFLVTEKLVKDLVKRETDLFEKEELVSYQEDENDSMIIERELGAIRLNGYSVNNPYGKKVRELDLSVIISFSPRSLISQIQQEIAAIFHRTNCTFQTFAYAGSSITQDLFISDDQFLFVDVSSEMTDVVVVKDSAYREAISFPYGTHTLIRAIALKLNFSILDTQSLLSLYATGKLESGLTIKLEKVVSVVLQQWTRSFEVSLEKLATQFAIPHTIALLIEPGMLSIFKQAILDETFAQHMLTAKSFGVVPLYEVPWNTFTRQTVQVHPRSSIGALLIAKYMNNK